MGTIRERLQTCTKNVVCHIAYQGRYEEYVIGIKKEGRFFRTLRQNSVFLEQQLINSVDPIRVGVLLYSHLKCTDGIQAMYHINKGLNKGSDKPVKIQLAAHMMYVGSKGSKVFTRLLAV